MLTRATFKNFKSLADVAIDLSDFTVLVGPNGCGKTSILQGIHYASQVGLPAAADAASRGELLGKLFAGRRDPRRLVRSGASRIELGLERADDRLSISLEIPGAIDARPRITVGVASASRAPVVLPAGNATAARAAGTYLRSPAVRAFSSVVFLQLDAAKMVLPSASDDEQPRLEFDGEGLASVLAYLAGAEPETKEMIEQDLRAIVPQVRGIRTYPERVARQGVRPFIVGDRAVEVPETQWVPGHRFSLDMFGGGSVPADLLSEGTVIALGLLTALHTRSRPALVLLDDIDQALHLSAQHRLIRALRTLQAGTRPFQIVCTSHSPYLVDALEASEVRVARLDNQGHSVVRALSDAPDFERWREALRAGELWASLGEDWVGAETHDGS